MNSLTKITLVATLALSFGFSVVPAHAKPKISFAKCLETRSRFICKIKSALGSVEKDKKVKASSSERIDDLNNRGMLAGLVREASKSKYSSYEITCGEKKLLDMVEAKTSPKRIISNCFKAPAKSKK